MVKIDFVLPWVDGNDVAWQQSKDRYSPKSDNDANANKRFRDMETLKYVLRSIEEHCPWYHKIYLITEGHVPKWLNLETDRVVLVSHESLYSDSTHLPVFSSSSIEMNLVNIEALSEQFVYLNDDVLIMQAVEPSRFFVEGKPVDFLSHGWIARNKLFDSIRPMDTWVHSLNNTIRLINQVFSPSSLDKAHLYHHSYGFKTKISNFLLATLYKKYFWFTHWHHPQAYLKSTLKDVYDRFEEEMLDCSSNRFRDNSDLTAYLYRYWQLASGNFHPLQHHDGYDVDIVSHSYLKNAIDELRQNKKIYFACFNDQMSNVTEEVFLESKEILVTYLNKKFPNKASFEQ